MLALSSCVLGFPVSLSARRHKHSISHFYFNVSLYITDISFVCADSMPKIRDLCTAECFKNMPPFFYNSPCAFCEMRGTACQPTCPGRAHFHQHVTGEKELFPALRMGADLKTVLPHLPSPAGRKSQSPLISSRRLAVAIYHICVCDNAECNPIHPSCVRSAVGFQLLLSATTPSNSSWLPRIAIT